MHTSSSQGNSAYYLNLAYPVPSMQLQPGVGNPMAAQGSAGSANLVRIQGWVFQLGKRRSTAVYDWTTIMPDLRR